MTECVDLKPLPADEWDAALSRVIDDMNGRPLNVHGLMAHNPALLAAWWDFRMHAVGRGALSDRHRELVILRVAVHMQAWYEWASHVQRAAAAGLTVAEIANVRRGPEGADWDPLDGLVLRAVDDCMLFRRMRADTLQALQERFSAAQVLDMIAIQGMYVMLGVMINTWDLKLDESVKLPPGITEEGWPDDC